jgi:hypothetical protein
MFSVTCTVRLFVITASTPARRERSWSPATPRTACPACGAYGSRGEDPTPMKPASLGLDEHPIRDLEQVGAQIDGLRRPLRGRVRLAVPMSERSIRVRAARGVRQARTRARLQFRRADQDIREAEPRRVLSVSHRGPGLGTTLTVFAIFDGVETHAKRVTVMLLLRGFTVMVRVGPERSAWRFLMRYRAIRATDLLVVAALSVGPMSGCGSSTPAASSGSSGAASGTGSGSTSGSGSGSSGAVSDAGGDAAEAGAADGGDAATMDSGDAASVDGSDAGTVDGGDAATVDSAVDGGDASSPDGSDSGSAPDAADSGG